MQEAPLPTEVWVPVWFLRKEYPKALCFSGAVRAPPHKIPSGSGPVSIRGPHLRLCCSPDCRRTGEGRAAFHKAAGGNVRRSKCTSLPLSPWEASGQAGPPGVPAGNTAALKIPFGTSHMQRLRPRPGCAASGPLGQMLLQRSHRRLSCIPGRRPSPAGIGCAPLWRG